MKSAEQRVFPNKAIRGLPRLPPALWLQSSAHVDAYLLVAMCHRLAFDVHYGAHAEVLTTEHGFGSQTKRWPRPGSGIKYAASPKLKISGQFPHVPHVSCNPNGFGR